MQWEMSSQTKGTYIYIETVSAVQTVKHALRSRGKNFQQFFKRKSVKFTPVSLTLVNNLASAYKKCRNKKRQKPETSLVVPHQKVAKSSSSVTTKKAAKTMIKEPLRGSYEKKASLCEDIF